MKDRIPWLAFMYPEKYEKREAEKRRRKEFWITNSMSIAAIIVSIIALLK